MPIQIHDLIEVAGGEIVGKVRLQKVVYLLDQLGMNSGFSYDYHHYGPYSAELADQLDEELSFGRVNEDIRRRASDGVPYSIFRSAGSSVPTRVGELPLSRARQAVTAMERRSATVLELAATIHWLTSVEGISNWRRELASRKGAKVEGGRQEAAVALLNELGLAPAA